MPQPLISALAKVTLPGGPLGWEGDVPIVSGGASVPVELRVTGAVQQTPVGVDLVFVIDNSGSMDYSDPDKKRFAAIQALSEAFSPTREGLDRIAIVTFRGAERDGDLRVEVDSPNSPWKTWTQSATRAQALMDSSPGGYTPLAEAMRKTDALMTNSNGFYQLAILLSDGFPEPDDDQNPQTSTILYDIVPNECVAHRIMYSTIYLYKQPPEDNALLMYIARVTDYITQYGAGDPPAYYFRISSPTEMTPRYRALFDVIKERLVPQDVRISERVDGRLLIDPEVPVTLSGGGFSEESNLLGGVPLADLLAQFRSSHRLDVHLNELGGDMVLSFSVKLNLNSVTDTDYANGYAYTDVDVSAESVISWLDPGNPAGSQRRTLGLPQARIKWLLGMQVNKRLDQNGIVRIDTSNLDSRPVKGFELAEYPSSYVDVASLTDDFGFHPFRMLHANRIIPWFLAQVPLNGLSQQAARTLRQKVREALQLAHAPVLAKESALDRYLCQFGFYENKPGSMIYDAYWNTPSQRGIYKAAAELPPRTTRTMSFNVDGASYLLRSGPDEMLAKPADALEPKGLWPMSEYTASDLGDWKSLMPNPIHYQIATATPQADLFLRTCFSAEHVHALRSLLEGLSLPNPWSMLDSGDITPIWKVSPTRARIGVSMTVYNGGDTPSAPTTLRAISVFLPVTSKDFIPPRTPHAQLTLSPPFFGMADLSVPSIAGHGRWSGESLFKDLYYVATEGAPQKVDPALVQAVQDAIVITTIDVSQASNERMQSNNSAIEIVPLHPA